MLASTGEDVVDVASGETRCTKQAISDNLPYVDEVRTGYSLGGDIGKGFAKGPNDGDRG